MQRLIRFIDEYDYLVFMGVYAAMSLTLFLSAVVSIVLFGPEG